MMIGNLNKLFFHGEKFLLLPFLFPYIHNINSNAIIKYHIHNLDKI